MGSEASTESQLAAAQASSASRLLRKYGSSAVLQGKAEDVHIPGGSLESAADTWAP